MADPATFLDSNSDPGPYFPLRTACLFTDEEKVATNSPVLCPTDSIWRAETRQVEPKSIF